MSNPEGHVPVRITLPNGEGTRVGWHEPWRHLLVWKEPAEIHDEDEFGPEGWYWAHLHESEAEFTAEAPLGGDAA